MLYFDRKLCSLKLNLGGAGKMSYLRWFLKKNLSVFMSEVDPLWIFEYDLHTKLEDLYTAFPYSIRPSRNVSDVMDPMATPY